MRLENLLVHRATLLMPGQESGKDAYNRPIFSEPTTKQVKCRLDQLRVRTSTDAEGEDVILSYILFLGPDENIDTDMSIYNVIDKQGNVVVDGTFHVENIHPVYGRRLLHHYEINLSRGDVNYG